MQLFASDDEVAALDHSLPELRGEPKLAATVALAWHLRQRDSVRALRLVNTVLPLIGGPVAAAAAEAPVRVPHRARAALAAGEAQALLCEFDAAERWLAEARAHVDPGTDAQAEGDAFLVESLLAKTRGQRERELAAIERAIEFYAASGAPERLSVARMWASYERSFTQPELESSLGLEPPGQAWPQATIAWDALWSAARALGLSYRNPAAAAAVFQHAAGQARQVGMVRLEIMATINAGAARQGTGDFDMAGDCFDLAATRARATGWPMMVGAADTRVGELLQTLGAFEESRALLSEAILRLSAVPRSLNMAIACTALAQTLLAMERPVEALEPMREAIEMYRETGFSHTLALNLIFQARGLVAAGLPTEALAVLDEAQAMIDHLQLDTLHAGVTDVLADLHHRFTLPPPAGMTLPSAALHFGEATLARGRAIEGWKAPARLHSFLAERWAEAGDHARAYEHARQALQAKEQESTQKMNYPLALARLRRRTARPSDDGAPPVSAAGEERPRRPPGATLTPKERSILLLLARNYSNKEIAKALDTSDETVKWHLKNLFNKLGAGSRKHAVTRARTLGFISFSA